MKSLVETFEYLLQDCSRRCGAPYRRDYLTLSRRVENEGESFLTITLPSFCQSFERSLALGRIAPTAFQNFRKVGCKPAFLQEYMRHVFDDDGVLLDDPSVVCIQAIRQICLFAKKVERPCTRARSQAAVDAFVQCEREVKNLDLSGSEFEDYGKIADILMSSIAHHDFYGELIPYHGRGSTVDKLVGNHKWALNRWHERLEAVFPWTEFGVGSLRNLFEDDTVVPNFAEPGDEPPVKVTLVPKTLKTPRVIAVEPACMQYAQQALLRWLVPRIEKGHLTSGRVNFARQEVNQAMAEEGSKSGKYATLDLSEASDRVSYLLAKRLFRTFPDFWEIVDSSRSRRAKLPDGTIVPLGKFASMGSAMCFPVESLVFFTLAILARQRVAKCPITSVTVKKLGRDIYVYGDDIITPCDEAPAVCRLFQAFGLRINAHKSFWTGKFRESCGGDFYDGTSVKPVYLRKDPPTDRRDSASVVSLVATVNQLFEAGYWATAYHLKERVEGVIGGLPTVPKDSPILGVYFYSEVHAKRRWNNDLQREEMHAYVASPVRVASPISGDAALSKCFRVIGLEAIDPRHLLEHVGPYSLTLKRRWAPLYANIK